MTNAQLHGCKFEGWQCFHCGEVFETVGGAAAHFGAKPDAIPGCLIKVQLGQERGLEMALRDEEEKVTALRSELQAARDELAEVRAKNLKVVAVVEESERDGCDPFVAKIRWLFNPVPEGEELYWAHPPEIRKPNQEKL